MIPYGRQSVDDDDIEAVVKVLRGDWLTQGPAVEAFEDLLAAKVEARYAVSFANGTAALHAAAWAAGLGPGARLATSPLTFVASANCGHYVGADVQFVDIDPLTYNVDVAAVPHDIDALVAVHYAGLPVQLDQLRNRPSVVIEDAAHAIGARTADGPVGNCAHSDMCCFSFHPVKTVTTAEGGAVTTNDERLAERLRQFRHHGIVPRPDIGAWAYEVPEPGMNYRLTDVHAALGASQLTKLDRFVARRNVLAARYRELLSDLPVRLAPEGRADVTHGRHLYPIHVANRAAVFERLRAAGIGVQVHYVPVTHHPAYGNPTWSAREFPITESIYQGLLSLPMFPDLSDQDQEHVVRVLGESL